MQILIEIPDSEIPKNQELVHLSLHFIDRHICECSYPYMELPKGHGDLIDRSNLISKGKCCCRIEFCSGSCEMCSDNCIEVGDIKREPIVIPADEESEK